MKRFLLLSAALFAAAVAVSAPRVYTLANDRLTLRVEVDDAIRYAVDAPAGPILLPSRLAMTLGDGRTLGEAPRVRRSVRRTVGETIEAPLYRQRLFETHYELLELEFAGDYAVEFRLYPDGVAYRFRTASKEPFRVERETAEWCFAADFAAEVTYVRPGGSDPYRSSFENQYLSEPLSACRGRETLIFAPLYVDCGAAGRVLVTESDVESYPGMFLRAGGQPHSVEAEHPGYPTDYVTDGSNARYPSAYAGHIARVEGTRTFPWRLLVYGRTDAELADNNMVYQTASPSRVADTSWIRGGHAAWDWWNGITVAGVDFRSGVNTETYLHYVDFAARYGLEYVLIDDGWYSYEHHDLLRPRDEVDLAKIVAYGRSRGVDILLWAVGNTFCEQLEAVCAHYAAMGVKGFKVDFFDRQDQPLVESLYRMAETTARYGLTIDFHGIYKPTGLSRTYPNVVNYEGVFGLEQLKWTDRTEADMPRNDALLPFTRGAVGPLDYTPGAMLPRRGPVPHEPGDARTSGGALRDLRLAAGHPLRHPHPLRARGGDHAVHRLDPDGGGPHARVAGRARRVGRHGPPQGRYVVDRRHHVVDAARRGGRSRPAAGRGPVARDAVPRRRERRPCGRGLCDRDLCDRLFRTAQGALRPGRRLRRAT